MNTTEPRKLRSDLTPEQREQAEKVGRIETGRYSPSRRFEKFVPSKEQH